MVPACWIPNTSGVGKRLTVVTPVPVRLTIWGGLPDVSAATLTVAVLIPAALGLNEIRNIKSPEYGAVKSGDAEAPSVLHGINVNSPPNYAQ